MTLRQKVLAAVKDEHGHVGFYEGLWAKPIAGNRYRLDNIPFCAFGLSCGDVVETAGEENTILRVVERSGHSTYRVKMLSPEAFADFARVWPELDSLGCSFEGTTQEAKLFAIDVPHSTDVTSVYEILEKHERSGLWEFEEGYYHS